MSVFVTIGLPFPGPLQRRRTRGARDGQDQRFSRSRIPRVARLMALAIRFEKLLRDGVVRNQSELAQLGHVSSARVSQILNLLYLAPDIQEEILHLPPSQAGRDRITEKHL